MRLAFINETKALEMLLHTSSDLMINELWIGIDDQDGDENWENSLGELSNAPFLSPDQIIDRKSNCSLIEAKNRG